MEVRRPTEIVQTLSDADADGFTGWYELSALGSSPNLAAYPGATPAGFVDVVAVVTSSLPCVLRLAAATAYSSVKEPVSIFFSS